MIFSRVYNHKTGKFSDSTSNTYLFNCDLATKLKIQNAVRAADSEKMKIRREFYDLEDAGIDPNARLEACFSKYWKRHIRRGYEIHEFIGEY